MRLLDIEVTPFCKTVWVSADAQRVWAPIIQEVSQMVHQLEIDSVAAGLRRCAWQTVDEGDLRGFDLRCEKKGLIVLPVRRVGKWEGFAHRTIEPTPGQPANVYCIVSKDAQSAIEYRRAFEAGDNDKQGEFLGFPKCCRQFFRDTFEKGFVDPVWQWAAPGDGENQRKAVKAHQLSNPLLRYIGVRGGFHIPCGPMCAETIRHAQDRLELGNAETVSLLISLLTMPMRWDASHGAAVISTPIFQVITSTVPTLDRFAVDVMGDYFPEESVRGKTWPYNEVPE